MFDIFDMFRQDVTVLPKNVGYWDINGLWIETDGSPFVTRASVQPASGRDMEMLPEGRITEETFRLYSNIRLHTVSENTNPDVVILGLEIEDVDKFEVITVFPWQNQVINHYKMLIGKIDPDQEL